MKKLPVVLAVSIAFMLSGCIGDDDMAIHITTLEQLQAMKDDLTADYILDNDIDASATVGWNEGLGFEPIGDWNTGFSGSFDGQNHIITNLYINRPGELTGLFGWIKVGATVENVTLFNVNITGGSDAGGLYVGGLAGDLGQLAEAPYGYVTNCHITGSVRGGTLGAFYAGGLAGWCGRTHVSGCSYVGVVEGTNCSGGLFGRTVSGNVSQCSAVADVTAETWGFSCGGLIGFVYGDSVITRCWSGGSVGGGTSTVGGLIGLMREILGTPSMSDCYSTAQVSATADGAVAGGLIADIRDCSMARCYSTGTVSTGEWGVVGGLVGSVQNATVVNSFWDTESSGIATSAGGTGKTTAEMKTKSTFTGWDFDTIWGICEAPYIKTYPWLQWEAFECQMLDKEAPWKEDVIKPTGEVQVETPRRSGNWVTLEDVMRIHTSSGKDTSSPRAPIEIGQAEVLVSNISRNFNSFEEASNWYKNLEGNALQIKLGY